MKQQRTSTNFRPYTFTAIVVRLCLMVLLTLFSGWLILQLESLIGNSHELVRFTDILPSGDNDRRGFITLFCIYTVLVESILLVDLFLEKMMPGLNHLLLKKLVQVGTIIIFVICACKMAIFFGPNKYIMPSETYYLALAIGVSVSAFVPATMVLWLTTHKWISALHEVDNIQKEKLEMDYNSLQEQLNPHFLFNNLSVLKSLIYHDKEMALTFTEDFSEVYRYVLQSADRDLVTLEDEIEFIDMFLNLHKARLGEGLIVDMNIDAEYSDRRIAPLSLQLLVENAIKHNSTSKENPLHLELTTIDDSIIVRNAMQRKESHYSTKKGLTILKRRYALLSEVPVEIKDDNVYFSVKIPLL